MYILLLQYLFYHVFFYFFSRDAKMETYQKMWRYMESNEGKTFVSSYEEGVRRVLQGDYAFLCESTMLDYLIQRNCNLTQIGGLLDDKGYGIATPKGSKWKDRISQAVLYLQVQMDSQIIPLNNI